MVTIIGFVNLNYAEAASFVFVSDLKKIVETREKKIYIFNVNSEHSFEWIVQMSIVNICLKLLINNINPCKIYIYKLTFLKIDYAIFNLCMY